MLEKKCLKKSALILIIFILMFQVFAITYSNNFLNDSYDFSDKSVFKSVTQPLYINAIREIKHPLSSTNSGKSTFLIGAVVLFVIIVKKLHLKVISLIIDFREAITSKISIYFHGSKYKSAYSIC